MDWIAITAAFIVAGLLLAKIIGGASRLGRGEDRSKPRDKAPLDFDTDYL